jgi:hypothetical protein
MGTILVPLLRHYRSKPPPIQAALPGGLLVGRREAPRTAGRNPWRFVPVRVEDERTPAAPVAAAGPVGRMEIVLAAGERILVGADVDAAALARVAKALSRR